MLTEQAESPRNSHIIPKGRPLTRAELRSTPGVVRGGSCRMIRSVGAHPEADNDSISHRVSSSGTCGQYRTAAFL